MNRVVAGAIVGFVGVALLLGGGGSFALWNGSATASAGVVRSGTLSIAQSGAAGHWSSTANGVTTTIPSDELTAHPIVPGDTLTYTQGVDVDATGNDLAAILSVDTSGVSDDSALATLLHDNFSLGVPGAPATVTPVNAVSYRITGSSGIMHLTLVGTVHFPAGDVVDNSTQGSSIDLSNLKVVLQQTVG